MRPMMRLGLMILGPVEIEAVRHELRMAGGREMTFRWVVRMVKGGNLLRTCGLPPGRLEVVDADWRSRLF